MPVLYSIADFCNAIPAVMQDDANRLNPTGDIVAAYTPLVQRAIQQRYSLDSPLHVVSDIISDGTSYLALPTYPDVLSGVMVPFFDPEFSEVLAVEYPIEQFPPALLMDSDFRLYRMPTSYSIMISADRPRQGDIVRTTWTAAHPIDGSTVPTKHFFAVVDYAASLGAETLASIYAQTSDPSMSADVVNYRTKSSEYLQLAKALRKRYYNALGIDEGARGGSEVKASLALGNMYENLAAGVGRITHQKYSR